MTAPPSPARERLPDTRPSLTNKRVICGYECYVTVGFYENGDRLRPGEVFVKIAKQGSMVAGLVDGAMVMVSLLLQHGVPWSTIRAKFEHGRFGNEAGDLDHSSLYDGIAKAIDHLIAQRHSIIGD